MVDKRADIWAFGCVLFEMLTGRPVRVALDDAIAHPAVVVEPPRATSRSATASRLSRVMPWIVAGAAVAAAGYLAVRPGATLTRESLELDISPRRTRAF